MYTVRYASTRGEIWRWYWRAWARPKGLWRYHVLISLLSAIAVTAREKQNTFDAGHFILIFVVTMLGCVVLLPLWPQIRFKPSVRTLKIDEKGFETVIGRRSGARRWKEIRSVEESDGTIVITGNNNNAFIVPSRAFASEQERLEFYEAARRFHAGSNP
jgi:PHD/YefM family antitoxin component YafN of YafNO toxin-antitoxin module